MMSAAASLGLSLLWDTDVGLSHVDKYTYSSEEHIKVFITESEQIIHLTLHLQAGALFATGILNTGVRTEADAALALLGEYTDNKSVPLKTSAIMGLGLAYAGSHREDILTFLLPHVADDAASMEISSLAALALGFIFVGSESGEVTGTILQTFMEKFDKEDDKSLDEKWARFMALGLGLLYLGQLNRRPTGF
jgi:26S proteasome regulatory subunit N1